MNAVIECSRLASLESKSNNDSNYALWNNNIGDGLHLGVGDVIKCDSAYINEIGVGSDTIEFSNLDNSNLESTLTIQFYKSGDAENLLQLPRNYLDDTEESDFHRLDSGNINTDNGYSFRNRTLEVPTNIRTTAVVEFNIDRDYEIYTDFYNQNYFNQRLTIMTSDLINPFQSEAITSEDINFESCYFDYKILTKDLIIKLPSGHLTPSNICSLINKQLSQKTGEIQGYDKVNLYNDVNIRSDATLPYSYNTDNKIDEYVTYTPVQCATYGTYNKNQATYGIFNQNDIRLGINNVTDERTKYYWESFHSIAVYDPELFIAGRKLMIDDNNEIRIITLGAGSNVDVQKIETDMPWTEANCLLWKNFIDAQFNNPLYKKKLNGNNTTRYIHVQSDLQQANNPNNILGSDYDYNKMSLFQEIEYYPESANIPFTPVYNPNGAAYNYRVFGFMYHSPDGNIGFTLKNFTPTDKKTYNYNSDISLCGCDLHFSAYGTNAFLLTNSLLPYQYYYTQYGVAPGEIKSSYTQMSISTNTETSSQINHIYIGAENPTLNFDSESSRFFWADLHTSRKLRNSVLAESDFLNTSATGSTIEAPDSAKAIIANAGEAVFTTFPRLNLVIYNPEYYFGAVSGGTIADYHKAFFTAYRNNADSVTPFDDYKLGVVNPNQLSATNCINVFQPNKIYDAQSGIFIQLNNITNNNFVNTLWDKLGFTFDGFGLNNNFNRQEILSSSQINSNPIMTNCEYDGSYIGDINSNSFGVKLNVPWCYNVNQTALKFYVESGTDTAIFNAHTPEINVSAKSFKLLATNKPVKQKFPYYTIRSNIILNKHYIGGDGGISLPVVAICNKAFVSDDYYFMLGSDLTFTVTAPIVLTNITTSIHNPLGEFASVDGSSSVIYMIIKNMPIYRPLPTIDTADKYPQQKKINK